ncbi:MAG: 6-carboxyhexanoate--CoA ligase [Kiritimatiellae bacterium]|nr:6-carboxyhexanoate--CoA ligase [Kiritimatiellia bacterium]
MDDARLFAVKMRAARAGEHISGAERIVPAHDIPALVAALAERALHHVKGEPNEIHLKAEVAGEIVHLEALPVSTHVTQTPEEGRACAARLLADAGITRIDEIMARFSETYTMRGAMLLDADTLERLEPDRARGVRATYMDAASGFNGQDARCPSGSARVKNHFAEAVVLATKVANAPGIVGEICVSDDPDYVTGYVATKEIGYCRITTIKRKGDPCGGRIFLYRGPREGVPETIRFLQRQCVLVDNAPTSAAGGRAESSPSCNGRDARCPGKPPRWRLPISTGKMPVVPGVIDEVLAEELVDIEKQGLLRVCRERPKGILSFASNDYQNLADDPRLKAAACAAIQRHGAGAGASRLVTGTLPEHVRLEQHLASFKGTEDAVVWATGYMANVGAISALVGKGDAVFSDALNHASIIDGCRLSRADVFVYRHGDMDDLARQLDAAGPRRRKLVVSDAVFSMDGDLLDLPAFLAVCRRAGAMSMIDEAHATGVLGATGRGLTEHFGCKPDIILGTLSKALGSEGGFVCASRTVCDYLRNRSRSFIFSTAPGLGAMAAADAALSVLEAEPGRAAALREKAARFVSELNAAGVACTTQSAIVPILIGDEQKACAVSAALERGGVLIPAIRYPTVARGTARLRAAVDIGKTDADLSRTVKLLASLT